MEESMIIDQVIGKILGDNYCGSCICGCDIKTRFICLGYSMNDINNWIENNKSEYDKMIVDYQKLLT